MAAGLLLSGMAASAQNAYYVKPGGTGNGTSPNAAFGTIEQARDAIRARSDASIKGDITVHLLPGTYFLKAPLAFDNRDAGRKGHKVIYQAQDATQPTVISGGKRLAGPWQRGENGIWHTSVEPGIFTQLYVNGGRATPCREPDEGWKELKQWEDRYGSKSIRLKGPDNLKKEWQRQEQIEFLVKYHWAIMRLGIETWNTYDNDNVLFPPKGQDRIWNAIAPRENDQRYRLENALEFVDEPGEWYLDRRSWRLYYLPRPGEEINKAEVIAPHLEHLVKITGSDADHPVRGLEFQGLRFEHANWLYKEGKESYVGAQAWLYWNDWRAAPGAVELTYTEGVRFAGNVFRNLGGVGLKLVQGTKSTLIERNTFLDIGDTAILIYTGPIDPAKADLRDAVQCRDDVVRDNVVQRFGRWNLAAAGISLVIGQRCIIEHNEVSEGGYAGITVGYFTMHESPSQNNIVRANHVHHVMQEVDDGAGIYVFNTHFDHYDKNSRLYVERNFIHDVKRGPYVDWNPIGGFYLDEGAQAVVIKENVVREVDNWLHFNTGGGPQRETLPERQTIAGNTDEHAAVEAAAGPRGQRPPLAPPSAKPAPTFPASKLLYHLPLNNAQSMAPATLHGNSTFVEGAMKFDGQTNWLTLPKIDPGNRYTLAMWVKIPAGTHGEQTLLSGPDSRLVAHVAGDKVTRIESWNQVKHNNGGQDVFSNNSYPGSFPTDKWVHLAWTVDQYQGANRIYLNGLDVTKTDMRSGRHWRPEFDSSLTITLGARPDGTKLFIGQMKDVRLYNTWLRPREIEKLAATR
jgi:hypothetical protein